MDMYLQEVNLKAIVACRMVKNHLGYIHVLQMEYI
jgi:hypothetical protein